MKYLILIFIICISGCSKSWTKEDKQLFVDDCLEAYGTHKTCYCILNCLESEYDDYNHVLQKMPASKVKKELNECLRNCQ
tara:strand:+ start:54 stop:293 length:240 start_codon:yes stop_codon:yes gene_type:complete